jgi:hypothetical protein
MNFLDKMSHWAQFLVTGAVVLAFLGVVGMLLLYVRHDFPAGVREVLLILVGVLAGAFKDCVGFWMGSSASSQKKDAAMAARGP